MRSALSLILNSYFSLRSLCLLCALSG